MAAAYKIITIEGIDANGKTVQVGKFAVYIADDSAGTSGFQVQTMGTDLTTLQTLLDATQLQQLSDGGAVAMALDPPQ